MVQRVRESTVIRVVAPYVVEAFVAGADGRLASVRLRRADGGEVRDLPADGAFIAVGHAPQSDLVRGVFDLDTDGYIVTRASTTETSVPGVFACGDLVDRRYRQAVTAAGSGCQAALDAQRYLERLGT
jgi:thioredoxin reductase (NADPH)